jgi:hypothetical protein
MISPRDIYSVSDAMINSKAMYAAKCETKLPPYKSYNIAVDAYATVRLGSKTD